MDKRLLKALKDMLELADCLEYNGESIAYKQPEYIRAKALIGEIEGKEKDVR